MVDTTINLKQSTKQRLDKLKLDGRESYDHVVVRLISNVNVDFEAILETLEILADKKAMTALKHNKKDTRVYTFDEV